MTSRRFAQVDVFVSGSLSGNPVAVVFDGDGLTDEQMLRFAHWTNLSETTFLCAPTDPAADYRLRIFTPATELPFAGHPTLGSAAAWLAAGGNPKADRIVQECGVGLVEIRRDRESLAFAAPLLRSGQVADDVLAQAMSSVGVRRSDVTASAWVDNGPGWLGLLLESAERVLRVEPDFAAMGELNIGLIGPHRDGGDVDYEVRGFCPSIGVPEDPVTGSLNAGLAVWLRGAEMVPSQFVVAQGAAVGRAGRVRIVDDGDQIWVGGASTVVISGAVAL